MYKRDASNEIFTGFVSNRMKGRLSKKNVFTESRTEKPRVRIHSEEVTVYRKDINLIIFS